MEAVEFGRITIVQVSTIFGEERDFRTLAVPGSDQHQMINELELIALVEPFEGYPMQQAAE
ncbi:hypothetical protein ASC97_27430 [Rhizobium sp. Root1203]|nr:hypothetical protein ASC97_27430 [Rhizobium sp. Root1203]